MSKKSSAAPTMFRQGDVLLIREDHDTSKMTMIKRESGRIVLAHGEVTGHAHAIKERDAVLFDNGKGIRILAVESEAHLVHEEHGTIDLAPGTYRVVRQREYSPEAIRNVAD